MGFNPAVLYAIADGLRQPPPGNGGHSSSTACAAFFITRGRGGKNLMQQLSGLDSSFLYLETGSTPEATAARKL